MHGTFLLCIHNTRSNSRDGSSVPAGEILETDTTQWWISDNKAFMTTTYALSRTFRTVISEGAKDTLIPIAEESLGKIDSKMVSKILRIDIKDLYDGKEVPSKFTAKGLQPTISVVNNEYPVWRFGTADYQIELDRKESFSEKLMAKMFNKLNELKNR